MNLKLKDLVDPSSLEWAIKNLKSQNKSGLLPPEIEVDAISANWSWVSKDLLDIELDHYSTRAKVVWLVPKTSHSFRAVTHIDPVDVLILTAILYQFHNEIEDYRIPYERKVVYGHRIAPTVGGRMFEVDTWEAFVSESVDLAESASTKYVVKTDIVDFYNQVSIHRIQNCLEEAGLPIPVCKIVHDIFISLYGHNSRGIPVGADFTHIVAELSLASMDQTLLSRGFTFKRYVDDYHFFCSSYEEALRVIYTLQFELNKDVHKLVLNSAKTLIYKSKTFVASESVSPAAREVGERRQRYKSKAREALQVLEEERSSPYDRSELTEDDLPNELRESLTSEAVAESFKVLFEQALAEENTDYTMIRHVLTRCKSLRVDTISLSVVKNLTTLTATLPHVCNYLLSVPRLRRTSRESFKNYLMRGSYSFLPYFRKWMSFVLTSRPDLLGLELSAEVLKVWGKTEPIYSLNAACIEGDKEYIRSKKDIFKQLDPRLRRDTLWACRLLPSGERKAVKTEVGNAGDIVDRAVIQFACAETTPNR